MGRNTVSGGGSMAGTFDVPSNPDRERALAEGRTPDVVKSAFVGVEIDRDRYEEAMERHGTDAYTEEDKALVDAFRRQRSDAERAENEQRDGVADGAYGRDTDSATETEDGASSDGINSQRSSERPAKSAKSGSRAPRQTAPATGTDSPKTATDTSGADSAAGSGTAGR